MTMKNSKEGVIEHNPLQEFIYRPCANEYEDTGQELLPKTGVNRKETFFLYFVVLTGTMSIIVGGASFVWTSPVIPILQSNNSEENPIGRAITTTEVSLIAGVPSLSMLFGSLLLGQLSELIGRKKCLQVVGLGMFLSGIGIAFSKEVIFIILFRCILFIFYNGALTTFPVYITEICEDHNRAKYGCLMGVFIPFGNLYSYVLGSFFSYKVYSLLLVAPLMYFLTFFFIAPESPVYSLSKGRESECRKALKKLRSNKSDKEIDEDVKKVEETLKENLNVKKGNILTIFTTSELRYALILAVGPILVQNFSGVTVIMAFMAPIFNDAGLSGNLMSIIVGVIKVSTITFTSFVVEKTGRRPMLLLSSVGAGIPLLVLGGFFYLKNNNSPLISHLQLVPLICVICNVIMYALGLGPIPMAIMGELFPPSMRSAAVSIITTVMGLSIFITTTSFPFMAEILGIHWCIWIYSFICFFGALFIYVMIPETKGKSIPELQQYLRNRKM